MAVINIQIFGILINLANKPIIPNKILPIENKEQFY